MNKLYVLLIIMFAYSCTNQVEINQLSDEELILKAEELYHKDQKWRRTITSLITSQNEKRTHENMRAKTGRGKIADRLFFKDVIIPTDNENTEELIDLTNKYGFPGMDRLKHKYPVCMVFVHSKPEYFPQIIEIIDREHKLGNMNDWEKDRILWHVERNREGFWANSQTSIWYGKDEDIMNYFLN